MDVVRITFVGSPLVDIYSKCDEKTLEKFNLKEDDCVIATEEHDELLRNLFQNPNSQLSAGGSAQNSARIAKWVLGVKGKIAFLGCAGEDIYESWMKSTLISERVLPLYVRIPELKTGICACLLTENGERSMITHHGAATAFSKEHLSHEHIKANLIEAEHIFIAGYLLSHSAEVVYSLADTCTDKQVLTLSLSAEYVSREHKEKIVRVLPRVDVLIGNEIEVVSFARALSGQQSITVLEALSIIAQIGRAAPSRPRIVIVTSGSLPIVVDDGLGDIKYFSVPSNVSVVDSVGCGDAFAGAFIAMFALTKDLDISVKTGIKAATEIAQVQGCNPPLGEIEI